MEKTNKGKKTAWILVFVGAFLVLVAAILTILYYLWPEKEEFGEYKNPVSTPVVENLADNPIDFKSIQEENPEVCAWIKVDGTIIDYPILRSGIETQEDFYLNHDWLHEEKRTGAIYIQQVNSADFSDPNTLIYGHNMLNGTMFGTLKRFRGKTFFDENENIYVYTPGHILHYKILSAFIYDDRHIINSFNFHTEEGYSQFLEECLSPKSLVKNVRAGISADTEDKIITLSTCTSKDYQRYLVVGVLYADIPTK